jgi:hypothetical protein
MSPPRRGRSTYRKPRSRLEVLAAIGSALVVLVVSGALVMLLRPRPHHASTPTGTVPVSPPAAGAGAPPSSSPPAAPSPPSS